MIAARLLIVLLAVLFGVWLWQRGRTVRKVERRRQQHLKGETMVVCTHCGVHVPQSMAVQGRHGHYCCPEHRDLAEKG